MRFRSDTWVKLAARGRFRFEAKARIGGKDYTKISAPKIERSLMSDPLSVGNCTAATLSISILTDDVIKSGRPIVIMGRLTDGTSYSEWLEFGTFFINQRDTSFEGLISLECYDAMLKANQDYLSASSNPAAWPKSMKTVVEEIAYRIGVGIDPRTKINTDSDYIVPFPEGLTMSQVLGHIGACHGGNWIITEENLLRLVPLVTAPNETFHIISHDYEKIQTSDGQLLIYDDQETVNPILPTTKGETPQSSVTDTHYITDQKGNIIVTPDGHYLIWTNDSTAAVDGLINIPVVCGELTTGTQISVTGVTMTGDGDIDYSAGDATGAVISIEGNPYATQTICNDLFEAFNGLVYLPYTASKALYDPAAELGDQVKIGDMVHSVLCSTHLDFDLNFRADIGAPNNESLSEEYPYLSDIKRLKQTTAQLNSAINQASKDLSGKVDDTALQAEIERATSVETELNRLIGAEEKRATSVENNILDILMEHSATLKEHDTAIADQSDAYLNQEKKLTDLENTILDLTERIKALEASIS